MAVGLSVAEAPPLEVPVTVREPNQVARRAAPVRSGCRRTVRPWSPRPYCARGGAARRAGGRAAAHRGAPVRAPAGPQRRRRDTLRRDPALCAQYEALKRDLAARYPHDRAKYSDSKTVFIRGVLDVESTQPTSKTPQSTPFKIK